MPTNPKIKDVVILIPGILGSRLKLNGKRIWGTDWGSAINLIRSRGRELLKLELQTDDPDKIDLGDGVTVDDLMPSLFVFGQFAVIDAYTQIMNYLKQQVGLTENVNLFPFPYDWRRDNRVAAKRLSQEAPRWLHSWRRKSGNSEAKIVILAHSMGGLIARYYIDVLGGWRDVRRVITFGTPYLGSIHALRDLYHGMNFSAFGLDLTPLIRSLTSAFQLLPLYKCIKTPDERFVAPPEATIEHIDSNKVAQARAFHKEIWDAVARNQREADYPQMRAHLIVGVSQPTVESAELTGVKLKIKDEIGEDNWEGDGTVPWLSAEPAEATLGPYQTMYLNQVHGSLQNDKQSLMQIHNLLIRDVMPVMPLELLRARTPRVSSRRMPDGRTKIQADTLAVYPPKPYYKTGETVELRVAAKTKDGDVFAGKEFSVTARVEQVTHIDKRVAAQTVKLKAERGKPGWYRGSSKAKAAGAYRITFSASDPLLRAQRVNAFFEVFG